MSAPAGWLPAPLHRLALRLAHGLRRRWWRWARPELEGVSVAAFDAAGRVVLVRHGYGTGRWALPGGGVHHGEDPAVCAAREFAEELGCPVTDLAFAGTIEEHLHGAANRVHLFTGTVAGRPTPDGREVIAAEFFAPDALPADCSASVAPRLACAAHPAKRD